MRNNGFEVIDLGKDVSHEELIDAARKHNPDIVGLSALMTTTMVNMKGSVDVMRSAQLTCDYLIGGAVVTKEYAASIGAHYAKDGVEAVRVAQDLINRKKT